jgi:AraC family transcriptional regulator of adaptative response / DNA-3-methyladenine glycosylase II
VLQDDICYRAMLARDYRFDGKFFVGVKTTGIYCRPICPARPRRENVEFFPSAHLAERKGYRPCLRCRPEAAPLSPAWVGKSAVVQRALRALAETEDAGFREEAFAARFGVTARHLRRLFQEEVGKSPKRILVERRLDFARKLIVETALPMARIAAASGFASLRRFNDAVRARFDRTPTALRKPSSRGEPAAAGDGVLLSLPFRPPLPWEASLAYYRKHAIEGLETIGPDSYERVVHWDGRPGLVRVSRSTHPASLRLQVIGCGLGCLGKAVRAVRRMFDLDADPLVVANAFACSPPLEKLLRMQPGLRCPRGWDAWEVAVCAILGQLVSMAQANRLIAQLVRAHGEAAPHPVSGEVTHLFPTAETLAGASLDRVGTTSARKAALREFARRVAEGAISLDSTQDPAAFRRSLLAIKGIGPWTAEYVSLRAIADADAFPGTDLVLRRALQAHPDVDLEAIRPWRGYAAAYLWHAHAGEAGKSGMSVKAGQAGRAGQVGKRSEA